MLVVPAQAVGGMGAASLVEIAQQLSAPGKGLLASDESTPTIGRPGITTKATVLQMPLTTTPSCTVNEMLLLDRLWLHSATITAQHLKVPPSNLCALAVPGKRLQKAGVENTEQNRRDYRQLFYTAPGIGGHISGERSFAATRASLAPSLHSNEGLRWMLLRPTCSRRF